MSKFSKKSNKTYKGMKKSKYRKKRDIRKRNSGVLSTVSRNVGMLGQPNLVETFVNKGIIQHTMTYVVTTSRPSQWAVAGIVNINCMQYKDVANVRGPLMFFDGGAAVGAVYNYSPQCPYQLQATMYKSAFVSYVDISIKYTNLSTTTHIVNCYLWNSETMFVPFGQIQNPANYAANPNVKGLQNLTNPINVTKIVKFGSTSNQNTQHFRFRIKVPAVTGKNKNDPNTLFTIGSTLPSDTCQLYINLACPERADGFAGVEKYLVEYDIKYVCTLSEFTAINAGSES